MIMVPTADACPTNDDDKGPGRSEPDRPGSDGSWPPSFPHATIDALLQRLQHADELDSTAAAELLLLVAREAQRLRTTVARLSAVRLASAREEARAIVAEAQQRADELRALALEVLDTRLDESERVHAALHELVRVERRGVTGRTSGCRDDDPFGYADDDAQIEPPDDRLDP
ncbi:hypothetical protein P5P86_13640 [Nocardioides sp. BP30]|uniref:hypothetical protein n=1 Tax=Nocardioides sp. BP30 TaxID=3036374 RepID=UPI002469798B|nr:hypothetical protein [Nocardioides sp. BP30]WGL51005.1 hypothetical protein P5P86_13640 [Nocardioides sp. BP30]